MRILLADNDVRVRTALHTLLEHEPGETIIAESSDLDSLVAQIRSFRPELVLLDWELPGRAAAALLFALNELDFRPKLVILSCRPEARHAALTARADGFVYKGDPPEELLLACYRALGMASPAESQ